MSRAHLCMLVCLHGFLCVGLAFAKDMGAGAREPYVISGPDIASLGLDAKQQESLSTDALKGSGEAALRLGRFYMILRGDRNEAEHWFVIGAENGNPVCMFSLWTLLRDKHEDASSVRAEFWLRKAAALGDARAKTDLEKLESVK